MSASVSPPGTTEDVRPVRRALVSVYDKSGLEDLVTGLHDSGVTLVSTGGSAALIESAGIPVTRVEEITEFPECLEGRVKTLHPRIHAGLLADTRKPEHLAEIAELEVEAFELVVCNLYPFAETVASGASVDECVEQIDIGGPSMVRAAAKNHPSVAVVTSPSRYADVLAAVRSGGFTLAERRELAAAAFAHTAAYDVAVATWMGQTLVGSGDTDGASRAVADASRAAGGVSGTAADAGGVAAVGVGGASGAAGAAGAGEAAGAASEEAAQPTRFPAWLGATWERAHVLRYGENPHQQAALYVDEHGGPGLAQADQLHGRAMSYNNYVDADAALRAAHEQGDLPTVAVVKHANPCGIAVGTADEDIAEVHRRAHACDPVSAFGGIIATNRAVTAEMARTVKDIFTEVVIAPSFEPEALEILTAKKNLRLLTCPTPMRGGTQLRPISGGLLLQTLDEIDAVVTDDSGAVTGGDDAANWRLVSGSTADNATLADLQFAWRAIRAVKSNAILLAHGGASVGIGMGQVNRVDSCHLAVTRAGADRARGAVAASDAFFPFADGLQVLIDAGVRAVVAPGGSIRDAEVIAAAADAGLTMYFTGTRHFFH